MKALRTLFVSAAAIGLMALGSAAQAQDKTIKIGALFPMSGPGSYFGAQDKQGVELALEQLNKTGVNGYKFVVQYEDSSCSPLPATQAAKRLIEQFKPDVIIGEECSDATLAVMPVVEQAKVPLLNAGSSSIKVTEPGNPWTFRIMPNEVMQGVNLAENASKRMKAETAVLLFENTNAGIGNAQVFKENFTKHGGKVLAEIGFGRDVNDFTAIATRVAGYGARLENAQYESVVRRGIVQTVYTREVAERLSDAAGRLGRDVAVFVKVEPGQGRARDRRGRVGAFRARGAE